MGRGYESADSEWDVLDRRAFFELNRDWLTQFNSPQGVLVDTSNCEAVDYFKLFFPDDLIEYIMNETNRYGDNVKREKCAGDDGSCRLKRWKPCDMDEISAFLGLQIAMGLCSKSSVDDYWSTALWLTYTPFTSVMGRNRYQILNSFLHFNNNENRKERGQDGYDPLFKIRPLLDFTAPIYRQVYGPGQALSIDESMVAFKGRSFFKQYMPKKPTKWGLKAFMLADSRSYFCLKFIIYTGKKTFIIEEGNTLRSQIVLDLIDGLGGKGHIIYTDNFYTSVQTYTKLKLKGLGACGTILDNSKGYPKELKKKNFKMKRGDPPVFAKSEDLIVTTFQDSKRLSILTTVGDNTTTIKRVRDRKQPEGFRIVEKPSICQNYNDHMAGVDHFDQMKVSYNYPHKSVKWYHSIFHFIKEIALINGLI